MPDGPCQFCGAAFEPGDEDDYDGWACGTYRMESGQIVRDDPEKCLKGEVKWLRAKIECAQRIAAKLPNDNGDPPDTEYQRGYMAACQEAAREIAAALSQAPKRRHPATLRA